MDSRGKSNRKRRKLMALLVSLEVREEHSIRSENIVECFRISESSTHLTTGSLFSISCGSD
jgi:hypothetical protein